MGSQPVVFNHVGLVVRDRAASRRFYEEVLGFQFWWEIEPPDDRTSQLIGLPEPLGTHATYLVLGSFVLELIDYSAREVHAGSERTMDQVGLSHLSFSVSDLPGVLERVASFGGSVVEGSVGEGMAMVRDPDGQLLELLGDGWLNLLPARPSQ